jgi:hypothetical protein
MLPKPRHLIFFLVPCLLAPVTLPAQEPGGLQQILERLDRLEQENRKLADEVHALRSELAGSRAPAPDAVAAAPTAPVNAPEAPLEERVAVAERRTEELSQTKVEAGQRLPVTLTGMVLFNAFLNGRANGGAQAPLTAALTNSASGSGASLSQSIIGLRFEGPRILGGGQVRGTFDMDLWGGTSSSLNHLMRIRVASIRIDWKDRSLMVGQDKHIIAPRDPESLSQVSFSPLTAAGNLWLWQPQVRLEQRFAMGDNAGLRAQASVYQTSEPLASAGAEYQATLSTARPALQGRFEFWRQFGSGARIEIAPGFHVSQTHVAGVSIPSRLFTIDWLIQPLAKVQFTGTYFHGRNAAGVGGLRQGFTIVDGNRFTAIRASGGWAQLAYLATNRLTFNVYAGQESDRAADLLSGQIARNFAYAANARYRIGSNVLLGLEANQVRTKFVGGLNRLVNHYDIALAYLF